MERAEPGLPAADGRQAERVAAVVAVGDVEPPGGVADAAAQAADGHGEVPVASLGTERDATERRLEPDEAGEPGRDADRTAAVAARGQGDEAAGHRRRAAARRAARCPVELPRVAGDAVELGAGDVDAAELAGGRLTDQHGAGGPQPGGHGGVDVADLVGAAARWRACTASPPPGRVP